MTKPNMFIIQLPFSGFYESLYSGEVDSAESYAIESDVERQAEDNIPEELRLSETEFQDIYMRHATYGIAYHKIANWYVAAYSAILKEETGVDYGLTFESMDSPREYNFATDRVYAYIRESHIRAMIKAAKAESYERLEAKIQERFTSRSGFISYYSNDLADWLEKPLADWDINELSTLFMAMTPDIESDDDLSLYYATIGDEGGYQAWESCINWPEAEKDIAELRAEKLSELVEENPEYVPPYRCDMTPDLFAAINSIQSH